MTWDELAAHVDGLAIAGGWDVISTSSWHRREGHPDFMLLRPPRLLFVKLLVERGQPTPAQQARALALAACHTEVYLWRPSDLEDIAAALSPAVTSAPRTAPGRLGQMTLS